MGGVSNDETAATTDLHLIMDGGENFLKRMQALQSEKKALQDARDGLHLAIDVKRGMDEVAAQRAAVMLETGRMKQEADDYWRKAKADAALLNLGSAKVRTDADAYAISVKEAADARAVQIRAEANALQASAQAKHAAAAQLLAKHDEMYNRVLGAQREVELQKQAVTVSQEQLTARHKALSDALAKVK